MSSAKALAGDFPVPKFIEGGCVCGALRYRVDFPEDHDFKAAVGDAQCLSLGRRSPSLGHPPANTMIHQSGSCQCTQCRKQTGSLFFLHQTVPATAFSFTSDTSTLKTFQASPKAYRAFCSTCGTFFYWQPQSREYVSLAVGTIDPLYLFGEGSDGVQTGLREGEVGPIPKKGYGLALAGGGGDHGWCANEIPGVTDNVPVLGLARGRRLAEDC